MFARRMLIAFVVFGLLSATIFGLTAVAKFKPYGVPDALRDKWDAKQEAIAAAEANRRAQRAAANGEKVELKANEKAPLARIPHSEHDFGLLDPGTSAEHTFVIENVGAAPLAIVMADTSCKCTLSETSKELVQPGESAEVTLTWKTGSEREFYRQFAIIRTNDPLHAEIELSVSGRVRTVLGFESPSINAAHVMPGEGVQESTLVFSQTLDQFEIDSVDCDIPGFHAEIYPALEEELTKLGAKCGWRLEMTSAPTLDSGRFSHVLRVTARIPREKEPVSREIPFQGYVKPSISFYGSGLDARDGLDLGIINNDKPFEHRLYVRVRGTELPESLVVSRTEPKILNAKIVPIKSKKDVYQLVISVPVGAEQTIFNLENQHGYVEVCDKDNPNNKNWFPVKGAVVDMKIR